jgi:hypothetical protein
MLHLALRTWPPSTPAPVRRRLRLGHGGRRPGRSVALPVLDASRQASRPVKGDGDVTVARFSTGVKVYDRDRAWSPPGTSTTTYWLTRDPGWPEPGSSKRRWRPEPGTRGYLCCPICRARSPTPSIARHGARGCRHNQGWCCQWNRRGRVGSFVQDLLGIRVCSRGAGAHQR